MPSKTLQIALLGGHDDAVLVGLRSFPAHKLVLIATSNYTGQAKSLSDSLTNTLKLVVEVVQVKDANIPTMLDAIGQIIRRDSEGFQDFIINVGSAGRDLACAGVSAAFIFGIKGFDVLGEQLSIIPVMKFSYAQVITKPKLEILRAIERSGGEVESLEKLRVASNYGKPLLSYHIRGSEDGQGLEGLGLVEVERAKRGRLKVKLTPLGRTLLSTVSFKQSV